MTQRERMEARAERRRQWAASRRGHASTAHAAADLSEARTGIPLGQPVLAGRRGAGHRRTIERADAAMTRAVEHTSKAERHETIAASLDRMLKRSIFSDDDNAIEALQRKIAGLEARRDEIKAINVRCRKGDADAIGEVARSRYADHRGPEHGFAAFVLTNMGATIRQAKKRITEIEQRERVTAAAAAAPAGVTITGDTWIRVTFAAKPDRAVLVALRAAGFRWGAPSWGGERAKLPACVQAMIDDSSGEGLIEHAATG